jgi:hypothetical protein
MKENDKDYALYLFFNLLSQGKARRWLGIERGFTEVCCMKKKQEEREYN